MVKFCIALAIVTFLASASAQVPEPVLLGLCEYDCDVDSDCAPGLWCADAHKDALKNAGYDERKANCDTSLGDWNEELCFNPDILPISGGGFGDPHFRTFDGTMYSYHGQCDLVMAQSADFGNGVGLTVHARTLIIDNWSLISNAAIQIGQDIFEIDHNGIHFLNGIANVELPVKMAGRYTVSSKVETFTNVDDNGVETQSEQAIYSVDLGNNANIVVSNYRTMLAVQVNAVLKETGGMLGIHGKKGMVGRDGETVLEDPNEMGRQWQVTNMEPMLFQEARSPQYPAECILPVVKSRRLRHSSEGLSQAKSACSNVDTSMFHLCMEDVLQTGDSLVANGYGFAF